MDWAARVKHPEERVGEVLLKKWRLDSLLGIGAMAAVFAATHRNGKRVAIKLLHQHLANEPVIVQRFLREGYASNRVGHPAVVSAMDDNVTKDGCPFLVMDFVDGLPLDVVLHLEGAMPWQRVMSIADQVLDALSAAHEKGVLHRDLKPENLLIAKDGKVRILDFGIARVDDKNPGDPRLTVQGRAMGTPGFMAPEQAQGLWDRVDARSDLWSLGATMFAALTGREVHVATKAHELLIASMTKPVPPIQEVIPEIPDAIANIVDRALAFDPGDRFPSARVMQEWIREVVPPISADQPSFPEAPPSQAPTVVAVKRRGKAANEAPARRGRLGLWLLAATALGAAGFVGAPALRHGPSAPAELYTSHLRPVALQSDLAGPTQHLVDAAVSAMPEVIDVDVAVSGTTPDDQPL